MKAYRLSSKLGHGSWRCVLTLLCDLHAHINALSFGIFLLPDEHATHRGAGRDGGSVPQVVIACVLVVAPISVVDVLVAIGASVMQSMGGAVRVVACSRPAPAATTAGAVGIVVLRRKRVERVVAAGQPCIDPHLYVPREAEL